MKTTTTIAILSLLLGAAQAAEMRTFTSAEGGKTLQAAIVDYSPASGTAKIKRSDGKVMNVPLKSLSEADRDYIDGWYQSTMATRKLAVSIKDEESKAGESKTNNAKIRKFSSHFNINVRNNGEAAFEDLDIKYRIFYYHDAAKGQTNVHRTSDGEHKIGNLIARTDSIMKTTSVQLTSVRPLPASQCSGGT
jgi:hypothetical protein